jgi:archaellum component FlaC
MQTDKYQEVIEKFEDKFDQGEIVIYGMKDGITEYDVSLEEIADYFISLMQQRDRELEEAIERLKLHKARHTNDQNIYNEGIQSVLSLIQSNNKENGK